jgi:molybdenum cofactor biosynthesis enzyme MoaA
MESVDAALESGVPVTFNRLLFRGYFDDLPSQIEFVEDHSLTLKLYDLLWTPEIADHYSEAYQGCMPVLEDYVIPRSRGSEIISDGWTRSRIRFHLPNGGCVEVKMGWNLDRSNPPCIVCPYSSMCSEQFGDYVRIEPDLHLYFCYLRRDIAIDIQDLLGINGARDKILKKLTSILGPRVEALLSKASLRLIVEPRCNFKCFFPGTHVSWCHKSKINGLSDRGLATRPNPL